MGEFKITPVIKITLFYISGLLLSFFIPAVFISFLSVLLLVLVLFFVIKKFYYSEYYLFILIPALLFGWYSSYNNELNRLKPYYNKKVILTGRVVEYNKPLKKYNKVLLETRSINNVSVSGRVNLFIKKNIGLLKNSIVTVRIKLKEPRGPANFGEFDYGLYYKYYRIYGYGYLLSRKNIQKIIPPSEFSLSYIAEIIRNDIKKYIKENYSYHQQKFLNAVLLGERTQLDKEIKNIFINTGTVHILAISGLHIGIITLIFLSLFKIFFVNKRISYLLTLIVIILYNFIIGYKISIVRASVMFSTMIIMNLFDRDKNYLNALALSALLILLFKPMDITTVSFQLSFLATLGVILFTQPITELLMNKIKGSNKIVVYLINIISASIASQVLLIPVIIFYFHKFAFISIFANIVAIPLITFILFFAVSSYLFYHVFPFVSVSLSSLNNLVIALMIYLLNGFTVVKPLYINLIKIKSIILYYILLLILILKPLNKKKFVKIASAVFILILIMFSFLPSNVSLSGDKYTQILFFNIKGVSTLIKTKSNKFILLDGGYYSDAVYHILPYLKRNNIKVINSLILTGDRKYRSEGFVEILKRVKVLNYYDSGYASGSLRYQRIMELVSKKNIHYSILESRQAVKFGKFRLNIISPDRLYKSFNRLNEIKDNSLIIKAKLNNFSLFLTGELRDRIFTELSKRSWPIADSEILNFSAINFVNISEVLSIINPEVVIINKYFSAFNKKGIKNLQRLFKEFKIKSIFTQTDGAVKILINDNGNYSIRTSY